MRYWRRLRSLVNIVGWILWFIGTSLWVMASANASGSENAKFFGVASQYLPVIGAICASVASGGLLISWHLENQHVKALLDPRRVKIRRLRATIEPIAQFFEGRNCSEYPEECARVLGLYMQDVRESGLFDAPEFVDERVAMRQHHDPFANFKHVSSMMRHKRRRQWTQNWDIDLREFQAWLLEAIRREIDIEESQL